MELENFSENKLLNNKNTIGLQRHCQNEGRAQSRRSRCLVLISVCLGILCLLLIAGIIVQHFLGASKRGYLWGPDGLFISSELKSWSESRKYCKDRGADLVIIDTEEKQRHITSFMKESVWIGLTDTEHEGNMKWVDNSPLKQGFWAEGEPNNYYSRNEDCIELNPGTHSLNNWNDLKCDEMRKAICEK